MTSARVFINYRRVDSAGWARQLHGDLEDRFGKERVFRDVGIEPGVDFVEHIERVMNATQVCIVVIGTRWASVANSDGRRLDNPDDLVRREIERALERPDVEVIPVLVDGATMPSERELPDSLRALSRRNAVELSDARWDYDVEVLCRRLHHVLGESTVSQWRSAAPATGSKSAPADRPASRPPPAPAPERVAARMNLWVAAAATLAAAALAGMLAAGLSTSLAQQGEPKWGRLLGYAVERGVIWAIIGAIVAAAVATTFGRTRVPLGAALLGAGSGLIGGAAGGAGYMALKHFGEVDGEGAAWLLVFVSLVLPAVYLAGTLARLVEARVGEVRLAAVAAAALGAFVTGDDRALLITIGAVIVGGAIAAVLAASPHRAPAAPPRPARG